MDENANTSVVAAANPLTNAPESIMGRPRGIAAGADYGNDGRLRNEDEVTLGDGRHRVRARRLRDGLEQDAGRVDHAQHGSLLRRSPTRGLCRALPVVARL